MTVKRLSRYFYSIVLGLVFTAVSWTASANEGVEAAQLDYVALDESLECNRILFQSTQHYKRTLFVLPSVEPGSSDEGNRIYHISPSSKPGYYNLQVNLYFPKNEQQERIGYLGTPVKREVSGCNWDKVKDSINRNITDPDLHIRTISPMPLTSIEMKIDDIAKVGIFGGSDTKDKNPNILHYYGKVISVMFEITESERTLFQNKIVKRQGVPAYITFRFQARSRDGSVTAKINVKNLAQNFSAQAAARGMKFVASGTIAAMLRNSLNETSIQITTEAGTSDSIAKVSDKIIEKILAEISLLPAQATKTEKTELGAPGPGMVSVQAAIDIIQMKISSNFSYNTIKAPETASAKTSVKLSSEFSIDPNITPIYLEAGGMAQVTGFRINAGETIIIQPNGWKTESKEYREVKKYLTASDIIRFNLETVFHDLTNTNVKLENLNINGFLIAEAKWRPFYGDFAMPSYTYRWMRTSYELIEKQKASAAFPRKKEILLQLPVFLSFSEIGEAAMFSLSTLLEPSPYWSAVYEPITGRIFLTAKQDLGAARFRQRIKEGEDTLVYAKNEMILEKIEQLDMGLIGNPRVKKTLVLKKGNPILFQQTLSFLVRNPQKINVQWLLKNPEAVPMPAPTAPGTIQVMKP